MNILTWLMSQSGRPDIFCFFIGLFILGYLGFSVILAHAVFLWFGHLYFSRPDECISHLPLWYLLFLYRVFIWGYLPPSSCSVAVKHSPLLSHKPDTNRSNAFQLIKQMWTLIQSHASRCLQKKLCIQLCKFHEQQIISDTTFCRKGPIGIDVMLQVCRQSFFLRKHCFYQIRVCLKSTLKVRSTEPLQMC